MNKKWCKPITFSSEEVLEILEMEKDIQIFSGQISVRGSGHNFFKAEVNQAKNEDQFKLTQSDKAKTENTFVILRNGMRYCYVSYYAKDEVASYIEKYGWPISCYLVKNYPDKKYNIFNLQWDIKKDETKEKLIKEKLKLIQCCFKLPGKLCKIQNNCKDDYCQRDFPHFYYCIMCQYSYKKELIETYLIGKVEERELDYCIIHGHELCLNLSEVLSEDDKQLEMEVMKVGQKRKQPVTETENLEKQVTGITDNTMEKMDRP